jgi:hypothetical protein
LKESVSIFEDIYNAYGLDDYEADLDMILPAALNVNDFDAVAQIVDGAAKCNCRLVFAQSVIRHLCCFLFVGFADRL